MLISYSPLINHLTERGKRSEDRRCVFLMFIMREFAKRFYNSPQWKRVRNLYASKHPLCEDCLERGEINPTEIVHHIIELTPANIDDVNITLNEDNLRAVCRACHGKEHTKRRYKVDEAGRIIWN